MLSYIKIFILLIVVHFSCVVRAQESDYLNWVHSETNSAPAYFSDIVMLDSVTPAFAVVSGHQLRLRNAKTGIALSLPYNVGTGGNKPVIAKLLNNNWYIFFSSSDGFLSKFYINVLSLNQNTQLVLVQQIDLRRPSSISCPQPDILTLEPVIQIKNQSNISYTLTKDIIFIGSHHGCGSSSTNMIYALNADNLSDVVWTFNSNGDYPIDYWTGFALDYRENAIYGTTNLISGQFRNTLWRINTVNGQLGWAVNAGSIHVAPVLGDSTDGGFNHIYTVNMTADATAYNPETGAQVWSIPIQQSPGINCTKNFILGTDNYASSIFVTLSNGKLYSIADLGIDGQVDWERQLSGGYNIFTSAVYVEDINKLYVGSDFGTVHQLNPANGASEGYAIYANNNSPVPGFEMMSNPLIYKLSNEINDLIALPVGTFAGGVIKSHAIPFNQTVIANCLPGGWENPANWSTGIVPDANTRVLLGYSSAPVCVMIINSHAVCKSLRTWGRSLTINPGFSLTIGQ